MNWTWSLIPVLACVTAFVFALTAGPGWAGAPVPAPLVGVLGPSGIIVGGIAIAGYLLVKRFGGRS